MTCEEPAPQLSRHVASSLLSFPSNPCSGKMPRPGLCSQGGEMALADAGPQVFPTLSLSGHWQRF